MPASHPKVDQAKSIITAFIAEDMELADAITKQTADPQLVRVLAGLCAVLVHRLASENGLDPVELWRGAMLVEAAKAG